MRDPRLTQRQVADALSVSLATVQNIERGAGASGRPFTRVTSTMRAYAQLVGWASGSVESVLEGGGPEYETREEPAEAGAPMPEISGLPLYIAEELSNKGPLLDTMVIQLPGGGQAVVVAKGKPGGTPDEIKADLEAWRRAQPQLQALDDEQPAAEV